MKRAILSLALAVAATAALAEPDGGEADYLQLCASCHGPTGKGASATAPEQTGADLTHLSSKDGEFPYWRVFSIIDGRYIPPGHDDRAMPVWGRQFLDEARLQYGPNESENRANDRIHALADYVRRLQR